VELEVQAVGDEAVGTLFEWQADIQADRLAAGLICAAIRGFHDPGSAARCHDEAVMRELERLRPLRQEPRQRTGILVVLRPLDGLSAACQVLVDRLAARSESPLERCERLLGMRTAVDPRRAEEHDGVLDILCFEAAQRLEILGENPDWARFFRFEKLVILIGERLKVHAGILFLIGDL
jgi:hypothetical protein